MIKGGLYIKEGITNDDAFSYFIENSDISFLSRGSYGIIFKCNLKEGVLSPYKHLRFIYKHKDVRNIIIKFSLLNDGNNFYALKSDSTSLHSVSINNFENEIITQNKIFKQTMNNLDPICPSIIYSKYYTHNDNSLNILKFILYKIFYNNNNNKYVKDIVLMIDNFLNKSLLNNKSYSFGLIGMELMEDYYPLETAKNKEMFESIARLKLIELAIKTGYSHNDFHKNNILVNEDTNGYYKNKGHVILVDFGYTKEIPKKLLKKIKKLYKKNNFKEILNIFYTDKSLSNKFLNGNDEFHFEEYPHLYKWITFDDDDTQKYMLYFKEYNDGYDNFIKNSGIKVKKNKVFNYK